MHTHTHIYIYMWHIVYTVHGLYIQDLRCFASHLPAGIRTSTCCVSVQDTKTGLIVGVGTPNLENRLVWSPAILGGRLEVTLTGRTMGFLLQLGYGAPTTKSEIETTYEWNCTSKCRSRFLVVFLGFSVMDFTSKTNASLWDQRTPKKVQGAPNYMELALGKSSNY